MVLSRGVVCRGSGMNRWLVIPAVRPQVQPGALDGRTVCGWDLPPSGHLARGQRRAGSGTGN